MGGIAYDPLPSFVSKGVGNEWLLSRLSPTRAPRAFELLTSLNLAVLPLFLEIFYQDLRVLLQDETKLLAHNWRIT